MSNLEKLARVLKDLTYEEMTNLSHEQLANSVRAFIEEQLADSGKVELDGEYFADLLIYWAEGIIESSEQSQLSEAA